MGCAYSWLKKFEFSYSLSGSMISLPVRVCQLFLVLLQAICPTEYFKGGYP